MPKVPLYNESVQEQAIPGVRANPDAPIEAFGGGNSVNAVTQASQNLLSAGDKLIQDEQKKANDIAHVDTRNQLLNLRTQLQYDPNSGFLAKKGSQVRGLPDQVQGDWNSGIKDIRGNLVNDEQRQAFDKMAVEEGGDLNRDLQKHLYVEGVQYDKDTTEANLKLEIQNAANHHNDPEAIDNSKNKIISVIDGFGGRNGQPKESTDVHRQVSIDAMYDEVINRKMLSEGGIAAKKYLDANQDISPTKRLDLEVKLEKQVNQELGEQAWNKFSNAPGARLVGGYPNMEKVESDIMGQDLPYKDKRQQAEVAKALGAEQTANVTKQRAAAEHGFLNNVISGKKGGWQLSDAVKFTNTTTNDPYDLAVRQKAVADLYAPADKSNDEVKFTLWLDNQQGVGDEFKINRAVSDGYITSADGLHLKEENWNIKNGTYPEDLKNANSRIHELAKVNFPNDPRKQAGFVNTVNAISQQKSLSPEEKINYANEQFKGKAGTGYNIPLIGEIWQKKNIEFSMKNLDATTQQMGDLHTLIGKDEVGAISDAISRQNGGAMVSPSDIVSFSSQFGGWQNIQKGTPVNNAIHSLVQIRKPVTQKNIQWILQNHPDGNY